MGKDIGNMIEVRNLDRVFMRVHKINPATKRSNKKFANQVSAALEAVGYANITIQKGNEDERNYSPTKR